MGKSNKDPKNGCSSEELEKLELDLKTVKASDVSSN